jgi:hypothetical protein
MELLTEHRTNRVQFSTCAQFALRSLLFREPSNSEALGAERFPSIASIMFFQRSQRRWRMASSPNTRLMKVRIRKKSPTFDSKRLTSYPSGGVCEVGVKVRTDLEIVIETVRKTDSRQFGRCHQNPKWRVTPIEHRTRP